MTGGAFPFVIGDEGFHGDASLNPEALFVRDDRRVPRGCLLNPEALSVNLLSFHKSILDD